VCGVNGMKEVHFQMFAGLSHQVQGAQGGRRRRCAPPTWAHAAAAVGRGKNWLSSAGEGELGASLKIVADLLGRIKLLRILRWRLPGLVSPWRRHAEHALRCGHDWRHTLVPGAALLGLSETGEDCWQASARRDVGGCSA
jgi:hypothetical protein